MFDMRNIGCRCWMDGCQDGGECGESKLSVQGQSGTDV